MCWRTISGAPESNAANMFACELRTRTVAWLLFGLIPPVSFETNELKATIVEKRPHELRTAERLSLNGVRSKFVRDHRRVVDPLTREVKQIGLADLANGYELKTLETAATFSSIDGYLRRAAKKLNVVAVVFDNTNNQGMSDEALDICVIEAKRRFGGRVYVLHQNGDYKRVI